MLNTLMITAALLSAQFSGIRMLVLYPAFQNLPSNELIVDVRSAQEFAEGHVPGAKNIPHTEAAPHTEKLRAYSRVYVYCHSGRRSQIAASTWAQAGLDNLVVVEKSGMPEWIEAGYPVEK